jgi:hypothetical protein
VTQSIDARKRLVKALLAILASALAAVGLTVAAGPAAADEADPVRIAIAGLTPLVPKSGDTLTVSGTATNTSADPISDATLDLRVSTYPLEYRPS